MLFSKNKTAKIGKAMVTGERESTVNHFKVDIMIHNDVKQHRQASPQRQRSFSVNLCHWPPTGDTTESGTIMVTEAPADKKIDEFSEEKVIFFLFLVFS